MRRWVPILALVAGTAFADPGAGQSVYEASCAPCHGERGDGNGAAARYLLPRPRDFTRGAYKLRSTGSGELPTDEDLLRVVTQGVPGTAMPGWRTKLSQEERVAVIEVVKGFSPRFARARRPPVARPVPPSPSDASTLRREGEQLYRLFRCMQCHGSGGRGDGPAAATTLDDWGRPITPADLVAGPLRTGGHPADIYRILDTGVNGAPMPSYAEALLVGRESFDSLEEVVAESGEAARPELVRFVAHMPTQAQIDEMSDEGRSALASRRLWALAHHVVSLGRPRGVTDWLFRDQAGRYSLP